ncbi:hypothetical protein OQA88_7801 [Cercophora sp. LCS_1]
MASISSINGMKAQALTIMATRAEDQDLVSSLAAQQGITSSDDLAEAGPGPSRKVIPAFGWHPWFSHVFYDDTAKEPTYDASKSGAEEKTRHYQSVLTHSPDSDFIASLPTPRPLSGFISETRGRLLANQTALVGEIGLDKAFRLPMGWNQTEASLEREEGLTPGGREGRLLSPHHVVMPHQVQVLKAQLALAGELGRAVSVHGVQAHGVLFDAFSSLWEGHEKEVISRRKQRLVAKGAEDFSSSEDEYDDDIGTGSKKQGGTKPYQQKPFPPRVCLHSFSGPPQMVRQYLNPAIPSQIYFSFSMVVNLSSDGLESKFADVVKTCPDNRILIESDIHTAGDEMDELLERMYREVCRIKQWTLEEGVRRIQKNYIEFIFG